MGRVGEESRDIIKLVDDYMREGRMGGKRVRRAKERRAGSENSPAQIFPKNIFERGVRAIRWRLPSMLRQSEKR